LRIFAVAVNREHAMRLMDMGIPHVVRRSYFSSLEMSRQILESLGDSPEAAQRTVETFRRHDEATLLKQKAVFQDRQQLIQSVQEAERELQQLFESDLPPQDRG
jgi:glutathione-regulated potassium-efflux system ancillary protein KefC/glutathione-regulated potassium-efflux system protein KefB